MWRPSVDNARVREALQRAGEARTEAEEYREQQTGGEEQQRSVAEGEGLWHEGLEDSIWSRPGPRRPGGVQHLVQQRASGENVFRLRAREKLRLILPE